MLAAGCERAVEAAARSNSLPRARSRIVEYPRQMLEANTGIEESGRWKKFGTRIA
jgi:hypothetical protein